MNLLTNSKKEKQIETLFAVLLSLKPMQKWNSLETSRNLFNHANFLLKKKAVLIWHLLVPAVLGINIPTLLKLWDNLERKV